MTPLGVNEKIGWIVLRLPVSTGENLGKNLILYGQCPISYKDMRAWGMICRGRGFSRIQYTPCPYKPVKCEVVTSVQGCLAITTTHSLSVQGVGGVEGIPACLVRASLWIGAWEALHNQIPRHKITENCINQGNKRGMLRNETFVRGVSW